LSRPWLHEHLRRAGAIAHQRHERIRDHYEDHCRRERYYDDRRGDDDLGRVLIGVAAGPSPPGSSCTTTRTEAHDERSAKRL